MLFKSQHKSNLVDESQKHLDESIMKSEKVKVEDVMRDDSYEECAMSAKKTEQYVDNLPSHMTSYQFLNIRRVFWRRQTGPENMPFLPWDNQCSNGHLHGHFPSMEWDTSG